MSSITIIPHREPVTLTMLPKSPGILEQRPQGKCRASLKGARENAKKVSHNPSQRLRCAPAALDGKELRYIEFITEGDAEAPSRRCAERLYPGRVQAPRQANGTPKWATKAKLSTNEELTLPESRPKYRRTASTACATTR